MFEKHLAWRGGSRLIISIPIRIICQAVSSKQMKHLIKYYSLLLSAILLAHVITDYIELEEIIAQTEKEGLIVDFAFNGWIVLISFIIIAFYELYQKNSFIKLLIRIFLTLALIGLFLSQYIPIDNFDSGVENTIVFSAFIAMILLFALGLKKINFVDNLSKTCGKMKRTKKRVITITSKLFLGIILLSLPALLLA